MLLWLYLIACADHSVRHCALVSAVPSPPARRRELPGCGHREWAGADY